MNDASERRFGAAHKPVEIRLNREAKELEVDFDDGRSFAYRAEFLRVLSPSAEVRGHGAGERRTVGGCRAVGIEGVDPVGNYAIRLAFDDGHNTGLYSWSYLYELGVNRDTLWREYLDTLAAKGLSRDPAHP